MLTQDSVTEALKTVKYPGYSRDIISFGLLKNIAAGNGAVSVLLALTTHNPEIAKHLKEACEQAVRSLPGVNHAHVEVKMPPAATGPAAAAIIRPGLHLGNLHQHIAATLFARFNHVALELYSDENVVMVCESQASRHFLLKHKCSTYR